MIADKLGPNNSLNKISQRNRAFLPNSHQTDSDVLRPPKIM